MPVTQETLTYPDSSEFECTLLNINTLIGIWQTLPSPTFPLDTSMKEFVRDNHKANAEQVQLLCRFSGLLRLDVQLDKIAFSERLFSDNAPIWTEDWVHIELTMLKNQVQGTKTTVVEKFPLHDFMLTLKETKHHLLWLVEHLVSTCCYMRAQFLDLNGIEAAAAYLEAFSALEKGVSSILFKLSPEVSLDAEQVYLQAITKCLDIASDNVAWREVLREIRERLSQD